MAPEWTPPTPPPSSTPQPIVVQSRPEVDEADVPDTVPQLEAPVVTPSGQVNSESPSLHPALIVLLLVALGLGIGAAIAWLL
jgi:hypothetical protein